MKKILSNGLIIFSIIYALVIAAIWTFNKNQGASGFYSSCNCSFKSRDTGPVTTYPEQ